MMAVRDKTQADYDIERLFDMLDTALTSKDERVQSALRALLTIVELTRPQDDGKMAIETNHGPLRQMQEDLKHLSRRLNNLEGEVRMNGTRVGPAPVNPGPHTPYRVSPGTPYTPGTWWGPDPNALHSTSKAET